MQALTIIKDEKQYYAYCDELEKLAENENNSEAIDDRIEHLLLLIEAYDKKNNIVPELNPVEYLKLLMSIKGVKNKDLEKALGINKTTLSHILNYRRGFSKNSIRLLANYFKVSQDAFNRKYELKNFKRKSKKKTPKVNVENSDKNKAKVA